MTLKVDADRHVRHEDWFVIPECGIPVRCEGPDGKWGAFDIAHLDRASLIEWLRSHGGDNPWAERVVCVLLGHDNEVQAGTTPEEEDAMRESERGTVERREQ